MNHTFKFGKDIIHADERYPGVYQFELFTPAECDAILEQVEPLRKNAPAPNSMNKYGVTLTGQLFRQMGKSLVRRIVQTLAMYEYREINTLKKYPYAFVVDYDMKMQRSLAAHHDSAHVTLNVCLGHKWKGGELVFYDESGNKPVFEIEHSVGWAIVHRASHVHRAKPLKNGKRSNLILWCEQKAR